MTTIEADSSAALAADADQPPLSLVHRLYAGSPSLEPLRVIASREVAWGDCRVTFHVLGASHAVRIEGPGVLLTELLACAAPPDSETPLFDTPAPNRMLESRAVCLSLPSILCDVTLRCVPHEVGGPLHSAFDPADVLDAPFPPVSGTEVPWTRISWRSSGDILRVETVHTYPERGFDLRSVTVYEREVKR